MSLHVLIEPIPGGEGYRASTGSPLNATDVGPTPDAAVAALERTIAQRIQQGAAIVSVPVPGEPTDLARILSRAGRRVSDEERQLWREGVDEYRRECDEDLRRQLAAPDAGAGE
jgi:hypothetical protein